MAGSIFIPLISVFDAKGIRDAKSGLGAIAGIVKNLKGAAVAAGAAMATVGSIGFVKDSVTAARDLDRNMVGLGNVFEGLTPQMQQFAKDASAIGLSQVEASRASTFLGSVLKQSGFEMSVVAKETTNLVGLASDLAATYGYDVSEALTGMTALFRGEYDPIEKFGVAMKQSEVNALLAARGQDKLTGAAQRNAMAQGRLDILYQRSQDAQGSYAQQSDSLFVAQKNLAASFENLKASLGTALTGPLGTLLNSIQPVVDSLGKGLAPTFETMNRIITMLTPVIQPLIESLLAIFEATQPIVDVFYALLEPLMIPLAGVFQLLTAIVKPLTPIIAVLANVFGAILAPAIAAVTMILRIVIEGFTYLFELLGKIPGVGSFFDGINNGLKGFTSRILGSVDGTDDLNVALNEMTGKLSKKIPSNAIDNVGQAAEKAKGKIDGASKAIDDLLKNARGIQSSLMGSFDINNVFDKTSEGIVESVVYVDGKFKTVVSGVSNTSRNLVATFQDNLTKIRTFSKNINELLKANLDPALIEQITSAGPDAGNATAEAIIASGTEGIKSLNSTFRSIKKIAGDIGARVATAMKNAGTEIGNGLIDGIQAQAGKLQALATSMAGNFSNAFKETLDASLKKKEPWQQDDYKGGFAAPVKTSPFANGFVGTLPAGFLQGVDRFSLMNASDIQNPFNQQSNPTGFFNLEGQLQQARQYNISVNVAPNASPSQVGQALVAAIKEYERVSGNKWRN